MRLIKEKPHYTRHEVPVAEADRLRHLSHTGSFGTYATVGLSKPVLVWTDITAEQRYGLRGTCEECGYTQVDWEEWKMFYYTKYATQAEQHLDLQQ